MTSIDTGGASPDVSAQFPEENVANRLRNTAGNLIDRTVKDERFEGERGIKPSQLADEVDGSLVGNFVNATDDSIDTHEMNGKYFDGTHAYVIRTGDAVHIMDQVVNEQAGKRNFQNRIIDISPDNKISGVTEKRVVPTDESTERSFVREPISVEDAAKAATAILGHARGKTSEMKTANREQDKADEQA